MQELIVVQDGQKGNSWGLPEPHGDRPKLSSAAGLDWAPVLGRSQKVGKNGFSQFPTAGSTHWLKPVAHTVVVSCKVVRRRGEELLREVLQAGMALRLQQAVARRGECSLGLLASQC